MEVDYDTREERVRLYSGYDFVGDIEGRVLGVEISSAKAVALRAGNDAQLATGAHRASVDDAIRLAATPTTTMVEASRKVHALGRAEKRLASTTEPRDPVRWRPMLAAAQTAEACRWSLMDGDAARDPAEALAQRSRSSLSPSLEARYRRLARERTFASAMCDIEIIAADVDALVGVHAAAVEGGRFEQLVASLCALAMPITAREDFAEKLALLRRDPDLFAPAWLIRPMMEAVIAIDVRVIPLTRGEAAAAMRLVPAED